MNRQVCPACGLAHAEAPEEVVVGPDAVERLVEHLSRRGWKRLLVVMDANTEAAAGGDVAEGLAEARFAVETRPFPQRSGLLADEENAARVAGALGAARAHCAVAVGSGVLTDLTRFATGRLGLPFVSVPTAASMDGYTSSVAAMEFGGIKVSFPARSPTGVFAEPRVLAAAPAEMAVAGLGDLLGKASARFDWLLAHLLYGEPHCRRIESVVTEAVTGLVPCAEAVRRRETAAITELMGGLLRSGAAMTMAGSSRPASGCEHHASHFWDLLAARGMRRHSPHGLQVGYATHFTMTLQRFAVALDTPSPPTSTSPGAAPERWLGAPRPELEAVREEKLRFVEERSGWFPWTEAAWAAARDRLAEATARLAVVSSALETAGIPAAPGYLGLGAEELTATFRYANRLRPRYTVLDFLEGQEILDEAIADAISAGGVARPTS